MFPGVVYRGGPGQVWGLYSAPAPGIALSHYYDWGGAGKVGVPTGSREKSAGET
jgi:hypothetical protein